MKRAIKTIWSIFFILLYVITLGQIPKKVNKSTFQKPPINNSKKDTLNPSVSLSKFQEDTLTLEQVIERSIIIDSTCIRCKGYKYDRFCDGLYCYSGYCSVCKGYKKCIHCNGTMYKQKTKYLKNEYLEGCPECTDGKCRICRGTGVCEKCQGSGVMVCVRCGGTGLKSAEEIKKEKIKKIEAEIRRMREREVKEMLKN